MRWLDHRNPVAEPLRGAVIALGNFDGFHLGHQAVARAAIDWAHAEGRPSIIATFDPHPVRFFRPEVPPFRLTTLERSEEHTSELQSLMRISYAVFCLKKKK